jgi:hypothetical protein
MALGTRLAKLEAVHGRERDAARLAQEHAARLASARAKLAAIIAGGPPTEPPTGPPEEAALRELTDALRRKARL